MSNVIIWPWCKISKENRIKFAYFVLLAVSEEPETWLPFFSTPAKKILDFKLTQMTYSNVSQLHCEWKTMSFIFLSLEEIFSGGRDTWK